MGPNVDCVIGDQDQRLFEMSVRYGLKSPQLDRLWTEFYSDPQLSSAQVSQLQLEVRALRACYARQRKHELQTEKRVHAKDKAVLQGILERLLEGDPLLAKLHELDQTCAAAIEANEGIRCSSD